MLSEFLEDLIINLDGRLLKITEDSAIYDNCHNALDLINKDPYARDIYKRICEITNYQKDIEEINEILQTYDIEIRNYHKQINK